MKKIIIKYLPLVVVYLSLLSYCIYGIYFRQKEIYKEYNNMRGVVTSYSISRNGNYMCYIKLNNGLDGTVNNGYGIVKVGDIWHNKVNYSSLFGITGTAYCVTPSETRTLLEGVLFSTFFIMPLVGYIVFIFIIFCKKWALKRENINRQTNE